MTTIVGVVPAKGHSERIPHKNRQHLAGEPLFLGAALRLARALDDNRGNVYVDSDDPDILSLAGSHGFSVLERPAELATNATGTVGFSLWEASQLSRADMIVQHLPTMPFIRRSIMDQAISQVASGKFDSITCTRCERRFLWQHETHQSYYDQGTGARSVFYELFGIYVFDRAALERRGTRLGRYGMLELNSFESIDIDYPEDLALARAVAAGLPGFSAGDFIPEESGLPSFGIGEFLQGS